MVITMVCTILGKIWGSTQFVLLMVEEDSPVLRVLLLKLYAVGGENLKEGPREITKLATVKVYFMNHIRINGTE